jgi:hypothetical protein
MTREPMARLSRPPDPPQRDPAAWSLLIRAAVVVALAWGGWTLAASLYRQQHCIYVLGHWLSIERTTVPMFCQ